jgi:Ala-tRNA(Pro) deacylase
MNSPYSDLAAHIFAAAPSAKEYEHADCRTSEESFRARRDAGAGEVTGAKALLLKVDLRGGDSCFVLLILPGFFKLDSKALKERFREHLPEAKKFRFASAQEMHDVARGMQPGCMPPYGRPIFPDIAKLFIDEAVLNEEQVGFNAARFDRSIVLSSKDYQATAHADGVFAFSEPPALVDAVVNAELSA